MRGRRLGVLLIAALIGGCGGGDDGGDGGEREPEGGGGNSPQRVEMSEFAFSPAEVRAGAGDGILAVNVGSEPHNLTIERSRGRELAATSDVAPRGHGTTGG